MSGGGPEVTQRLLGRGGWWFQPRNSFWELSSKILWLKFYPLKMQVPLPHTLGLVARGQGPWEMSNRLAVVLYSTRGAWHLGLTLHMTHDTGHTHTHTCLPPLRMDMGQLPSVQNRTMLGL